jgi:hypothetical protein
MGTLNELRCTLCKRLLQTWLLEREPNSLLLFAHQSAKSKWLQSADWPTLLEYCSIKVHKYKEYHSVCPLVGLGLSHPLSRQRACPSLRNQRGGGGVHSPAGEGLRESQFLRLEKNLALCLLCDCSQRGFNIYSVYFYINHL